MFHKNARNSFGSDSTVPAASIQQPSRQDISAPTRLLLVSSAGGGTPRNPDPVPSPLSPLVDLVAVAAPRCSSFFAEAAVLVLVLALLDRLMAKGHVEMAWVLSAFTLSMALLSASIATDFTARRWLRSH